MNETQWKVLTHSLAAIGGVVLPLLCPQVPWSVIFSAIGLG